MNKARLFFLLLILTGSAMYAQSDQAIGQWKAYLPYTTGTSVTQSNSTVYYAADFSILAIDKEENSIRRLSKVDGLSDVGVEIVAHSPYSEVLVVIYKNGNIDLVTPEQIINLPFVKNENILGDRNIYNVNFIAERRAFISTGFGILELNPQNATFKNDIRTGMPVAEVAEFRDFIYAATAEGIYRASANPNVNLQDFISNWKLLGPEEGFPGDYSTSAFTVFNDNLFLTLDDALYRYNGDTLFAVYEDPNFKINYLSAEGPHLLAGLQCRSGCRDKVLAFDTHLNPVQLAAECVDRTLGAIEDPQGRIWFADAVRQFRMLSSVTDENCTKTIYEGPPSGNIWDIDIARDQVWVATGGVSDQFTYLFRSEGFFSLIDGEWTSYTRDNTEVLRGENPDPNFRDDDLFDIVAILVNPNQPQIFIGSFIEGLVLFNQAEDTFTLFNEKNSSIGEVNQNDPGRTRISGLALAPNGDLWLTNYLAAEPFSVFTKEGEWQSFSTADCGNFIRLTDIVVDNNNNKWMVANESGAGIIVFNEGQDLSSTADDQCRIFSASNSNLPSNTVKSLAVDLDGDVWAGTQDGAVVFECGSAVFDRDICGGRAPIVNVGGDNELLLKGENVQAIAVDGANRKWFGTTNGIFVQNPNGDEQVMTFTKANSPLFDNNIIDIAINQKNGEVFIGSNGGLQSYRTTATRGGPLNSSKVKVFPNPVRPEYEGPIAIKGLARDANVKITDINGQLIFETTAFGGQAIWDGKDYNGRKAATGVYLVFSTSTQNINNPDAVAARILIVN